MKKIFFIFLGLLMLSTSPVLANETGNSGHKEKPSITIEFNGMENLGDEWNSLEKEFDGKEINVMYEDGGSLGFLVVVGIGLVLFVAFLSIACLVFWIVMLIHAISKPIKSKALWILILLLFGILGAIVYYFAVKRGFKERPTEVYAEKTNL